MSEITPRAGVPDFCLPATRLEPYYSGWWSGQHSYFWVSAKADRGMGGSGLVTGGRNLVSEKKAWDVIMSKKSLTATLAIIGALSTHRTMTFHQVAAMCGRRADEGFMRLVLAAYSAGVVDIGRYVATLSAPSEKDLWSFGLRLNNSLGWQARLTRTLTLPQRWALSNRKLTMGGQYDRHNILTSEFLLRIATYHDVVIGGEALTLYRDMFEGYNQQSGRRADGLIVRPDGCAIALETTASMSPMIGQKAKNWVEAIYNTRSKTAPWVLFMECFPLSYNHDSSVSMTSKIASELNKFFPGPYYNDALSKVLAVSYKDWFGSDHRLEPDFASLTVQRFDADRRTWVKESLLHLPHSYQGDHLWRGLQSMFTTPIWSRVNPYPLWALPLVGEEPIAPVKKVAVNEFFAPTTAKM